MVALSPATKTYMRRKLDPDVGRGVAQGQIAGHKAGCAPGRRKCGQGVDQRMANGRTLTLHLPPPF